MKRKGSEPILKMPYAKRKLIVVVDDPDDSVMEVDWTEVVKESFEKYWRYMTLPGQIEQIVKAIKAARSQGINVLPVPTCSSKFP